MPKRKPETQTDPLDRFATAGLEKALQLVLWKSRFENPEFTVTVTPEDLKAFEDCVNYLKTNERTGESVRPQVRVFRPEGIPERNIAPKNYVVVQMLDQDGNTFRPIENNEADRQRQVTADDRRRLRDRCNVIAANLQTDLGSNTFSTSTIQEAIQTLRQLA